MAEPEFRRINPRTIAVDFVRTIGRMILPLAFFVWSWLSGTGGDTSEMLLQGMGALAVISSVVRYFTFSYAVHEGHLHIRSGVFTKQNRTIPLTKIQNINISRNLVHRLLGLVDLKIETASGAGAEASLSALSESEAARVKVELLQHTHAVADPGADEPLSVRGRTVYKITPKELFLAGATENRAFAIIAAVMGASYLFGDQLASISESIMPDANGSWTGVILVAAGLVVVGWIASIVITAVTFGNFELSLQDGRLRRQYGLLNQIESVVPLRRVQVMRTTETVFQRMLGLCKLSVETAGSYGDKDMGGSSLVSPLLESSRLPELSSVILPGKEVGSVQWSRVSKKTVRHHFQRSMITWTVLVSASSLFFGPKAFWALVPLAAWSLLIAWVSYRTMGYDDRPAMLATRLGVFSRRSLYIPTDKVQSVAITQSPLQRRLGIATMLLNTAATGHGGTGAVIDLPTDEALRIGRSVHRRSTDAVKRTGEAI
ncbi:MAG: PH domain-containing protein [Armatimonadetes bacterium]|nr:PH domain-containing protein [Armatimonadota bacterium]